MATVLLAWEIGEGIGYARTLSRIAHELAQRGHQPVFALKDLAAAAPIVGRDFPVLQAPFCHPRPRRAEAPFVAASFADVLAVKGYASADELGPLVEGWRAILDLVRPRLVVGAYAPTVCLAAGAETPVVLVANGWFGLPPADGVEFPPLAPGRPPLLPTAHLLAVVRAVQRPRGGPESATLPAVLAARHRFLMMLPDLDPYRDARTDPVWDPIDPLPRPTPPAPERTFLAYLNADYPRAGDVLRALVTAGWRGAAYLRGASAARCAELRGIGVTVTERPVSREEMLAAALLVHHGGVGTSQLGMAAGRPQLLLPAHLEQEINGQTLHRLGAAHFLAGRFNRSDVPGAAEEVSQSPSFVKRLAELSRDIADRDRRPPLPALVQCCEESLR